jgi:hypothetical protein
MKTAATKSWVVVTDNAVSRPLPKDSAERIAKWLREGKGGYAPMPAEVKAVAA